MKKLTESQKQVLHVVDNYIKAHGFAPPIVTIATACSKPPTRVSSVLRSLAEKGFVELVKHFPARTRVLKLEDDNG